jgi:hypothetical protein
MEYLKQFEVFLGGNKNIPEKLDKLMDDWEALEKDVRYGLSEYPFAEWLRIVQKFMKLFEKLKVTKSTNLNSEDYVDNFNRTKYFDFFYQKTEMLEEMPSISSFNIDAVKEIYRFINKYYHEFSFPSRRFHWNINVPRD